MSSIGKDLKRALEARVVQTNEEGVAVEVTAAARRKFGGEVSVSRTTVRNALSDQSLSDKTHSYFEAWLAEQNADVDPWQLVRDARDALEQALLHAPRVSRKAAAGTATRARGVVQDVKRSADRKAADG